MHNLFYKRILLLPLAMVAFCLSAWASDTLVQLKLIKHLDGKYNKLFVDNLDNIYVLSDGNNQLKKMNSNGDSLQVFNDVKKYGSIYSIDVSNPLKIAIFYREFSTVVILDRFFNLVNKIDLRNAGIMQCRSISTSYDNNLWAFDQFDFKLKKLDGDGKIMFSSDDFRILFSNPPTPANIIDNNGQLYLYDKQTGWFLFDYYGGFKAKYPYLEWKNVAVVSDRLFGRDSNYFYVAGINGIDFIKAKPSADLTNAKDFIFNNMKIYTLTTMGIDIYNIEL